MTSKNSAVEIVDTLFPALCKAIVVEPEKLAVQSKHAKASSIVAVNPHPNEAGNLIGRNGQTIKSFELLAKLIGDKHEWPIKYTVQVEPGENPSPAQRPPFIFGEWDAENVKSLLASTLSAFLHSPANLEMFDLKHSTTFEVVLDINEPEPEAEITVRDADGILKQHFGDDAVTLMLRKIFGAIGKLHGKTVAITYVRKHPTNKLQEKQPENAHGRYAKELEK